MTNDDEMRGAEERRNGSGGGGVRPPKESLLTASLVDDYCDFYDDRLAFSSVDGPILLLAIPSIMGEGRRRY